MGNEALSEEILNSISTYADRMTHQVKLVLNTGHHEKRPELTNFLTSVASASDNITFEERDINSIARGPISFILEIEKEAWILDTYKKLLIKNHVDELNLVMVLH